MTTSSNKRRPTTAERREMEKAEAELKLQEFELNRSAIWEKLYATAQRIELIRLKHPEFVQENEYAMESFSLDLTNATFKTQNAGYVSKASLTPNTVQTLEWELQSIENDFKVFNEEQLRKLRRAETLARLHESATQKLNTLSEAEKLALGISSDCYNYRHNRAPSLGLQDLSEQGLKILDSIIDAQHR